MENSGLGGKHYDFNNSNLKKCFVIQFCNCIMICFRIHKRKWCFTPKNTIWGVWEGLYTPCFWVHWKNCYQERHKHFMCLLYFIDTTMNNFSWDFHPNWKLHPFLEHIMYMFQVTVLLRRNISFNEQIIRFQGNHREKQTIA